MNSRERIKAVIEGKTPDRMPIWTAQDREVVIELMKEKGIYDYNDLCIELGNDMLFAGTELSILDVRPHHFEEGKDEYTCVWGCQWKREKTDSGEYCHIINGPLWDDQDGSKLESYVVPEIPDEAYQSLRDMVEKYKDTHWIVGYPGNLIWEPAYSLHGMEDSLIDMMVNKDYMNKLFDKVMAFALEAGHKMIDCGADMLLFSDDFGTQESMLMSPDVFREFIKPRMKKVIAELKNHKEDIIIAHHSCGYIIPIIDDLIEIGVDVLQPIQPGAMDPAELKKLFGNRIVFWGGIDTQHTLPFGTEKEIKAEVALRKETIGVGGGYICSPGHVIQTDTPLANILAFYQAAKELGKYE